ncbi:unnamed protein product, partial [Closterium sp. Naga37s-1]
AVVQLMAATGAGFERFTPIGIRQELSLRDTVQSVMVPLADVAVAHPDQSLAELRSARPDLMSADVIPVINGADECVGVLRVPSHAMDPTTLVSHLMLPPPPSLSCLSTVSEAALLLSSRRTPLAAVVAGSARMRYGLAKEAVQRGAGEERRVVGFVRAEAVFEGHGGCWWHSGEQREGGDGGEDVAGVEGGDAPLGEALALLSAPFLAALASPLAPCPPTRLRLAPPTATAATLSAFTASQETKQEGSSSPGSAVAAAACTTTDNHSSANAAAAAVETGTINTTSTTTTPAASATATPSTRPSPPRRTASLPLAATSPNLASMWQRVIGSTSEWVPRPVEGQLRLQVGPPAPLFTQSEAQTHADNPQSSLGGDHSPSDSSFSAQDWQQQGPRRGETGMGVLLSPGSPWGRLVREWRWARVQYLWDVLLERHPIVYIMLLMTMCTTLVFLGGFLFHTFRRHKSLGEDMWDAWSALVSSSSHLKESTQEGRVIGIMLTLGGLFFYSLLTSTMTAQFKLRMEWLREGAHSQVMERDHIVIGGINNRLATLLRQLSKSQHFAVQDGSAVTRKRTVLLLTELPRKETEKIVSPYLKDCQHINLFIRSGPLSSTASFKKVAADRARSVILLAPKDDYYEADADVVMSVIALKPLLRGSNTGVVTEVSKGSTGLLLRGMAEVRVSAVENLSAKLFVQCSRQPGLVDVYCKLLDHTDEVINVRSFPSLAGLPYGLVRRGFPEAVCCGIVRDGKVQFHPKDSEPVQRTDKAGVGEQLRGGGHRSHSPSASALPLHIPPGDADSAEAHARTATPLQHSCCRQDITDRAEAGEQLGGSRFPPSLSSEFSFLLLLLWSPPPFPSTSHHQLMLIALKHTHRHPPPALMMQAAQIRQKQESSRGGREGRGGGSSEGMVRVHRDSALKTRDAGQFKPNEPAARAERMVMLGWRTGVPDMIREFDDYVGPGSELVILAEESLEERERQLARMLRTPLRNLTVVHKVGNPMSRTDLTDAILDPGSVFHPFVSAGGDMFFDNVPFSIIVVSDRSWHHGERTKPDKQSLYSLLLAESVCRANKIKVQSLNAELEDNRLGREVVGSHPSLTYIGTSDLMGLVTSQVTEHAELNAIWTELLNSWGDEIYVKDASLYVSPGETPTFNELAERAVQRGEVAIGYRCGDTTIINPCPKDVPLEFGPEDSLVLISEYG